MSTLSYRTECTIMSLAAAIQVMWIVWTSTWESMCASQTAQMPAGRSEASSPWGARLQSVYIYKHAAEIPGSTNAIWLFSVGNPLAAYLNTVLPKSLPKILQTQTVCWTDSRPWRDDFYEDGPEIHSIAEMCELLLFWYACHSLWWLVTDTEPDRWGSSMSPSFLLVDLKKKKKLGQNIRGGGNPKHWSSDICCHQGILT